MHFVAVHITDAELLAMKDKTNRHLRLRELILEHSTASSLIVMYVHPTLSNCSISVLLIVELNPL